MAPWLIGGNALIEIELSSSTFPDVIPRSFWGTAPRRLVSGRNGHAGSGHGTANRWRRRS